MAARRTSTILKLLARPLQEYGLVPDDYMEPLIFKLATEGAPDILRMNGLGGPDRD